MVERKQDQGKMKLRNETGRGGSRGIRRLNRWDGNERRGWRD